MLQGSNSYINSTGASVIKRIDRDEQIVELPVHVASYREAFFQELGRTVYENIPQVFSASHDTITMERINATRLDEWLTDLKKPIKKGVLDALTRSVTKVIRLFLSVGIRHRDISIENILIDDQNRPWDPRFYRLWIIDFGRCQYVPSQDGEFNPSSHEQVFRDELLIFIDTVYDYLGMLQDLKYGERDRKIEEIIDRFV